MQNRSGTIIIASIPAEASPQAVPLGAAAIASAIKTAVRNTLPAKGFSDSVRVQTVFVTPEEAREAGISAGELLFRRIMDCVADSGAGTGRDSVASNLTEKSALRAVGFSVYAWNAPDCETAALLLRTAYDGKTGRRTGNSENRQNAQNSENQANAETDADGVFPVLFAGGPEITASLSVPQLRGALAEKSLYDYIIGGEGETAAATLALNLLAGKTPRHPAQTVFLEGRAEDCAALCSPWLDGTLDPADFDGALWELSRGCPFSCAFCYESRGQKQLRRVPIDRLEKELDFFADKKVPQVFVIDPVFTADKSRALTLLALMAKKLPEAHFQIEIRAEQLDADLVKAFTSVICSLQIGLQSANPDVLKKIGRAFDRRAFARKLGLLNEFGVVFGLDLIYGLPSDTLPSFKESIDWAVSQYPNHLDIFRLSVLPGTELYDRAAEFGLKFDATPPYHVRLTPQFSESSLAAAAQLAFACTVFYSAGRAVPWFAALLQPLKIRPSQFFADFAEWLRCNNVYKSQGFDPYTVAHAEIEKMQLAFLELKYEEKKLSFALDAVRDIVRLNGAIARAVGEGQETRLSLSYHPEDLLGPESQQLLVFVEEICMEHHVLRVFAGTDGPDMELFD